MVCNFPTHAADGYDSYAFGFTLIDSAVGLNDDFWEWMVADV